MLLRSEFEKLIPRTSLELNLGSNELNKFWKLFDNFVEEIKEEYVKKIPSGGTPSDNIVRAMAIGRIATFEEILGDKIGTGSEDLAFLQYLAEQTGGECYVLPSPHGDCNGDGQVGLSDVVHLINYLFGSGSPPDALESGDLNCDDEVAITDVVYLINYLFNSGPPPCET